ncbi:hypothetical protein GCM10010978_09960 [Compostibacillus humi]|uniref:HTH cro/C1-type domain-containing protein n=1 Tax=Compostibacillus humi TaxID=1245525 RepID=A0A8J3EJQ7_9BACI|nr:helix-turn-helix transcriptional regulator [Compostibacillus humi]GGH72758.1 hypothetical protein GCM10010978_09960 [Compostibacillus humi]
MTKETFKLIRWYLRMNQEQFAEYLGVTYSTVAAIESGERGISENVRGKIAHKFDASDPDFLEYVKRYQALHKMPE